MEKQVQELRARLSKLYRVFEVSNFRASQFDISLPSGFEEEFFLVVDQVNFRLMEEKDHFYGYFLLQMGREIKLDLASPTGVNFKGSRYVMYYNPLMFLQLTPEQMMSSIQHEILHVLSFHLVRAKDLLKNHSKAAVNIAMDLVVNSLLDGLPPFAVTLAKINQEYSLRLKPYESFEFYAFHVQRAMDLQGEEEKKSDKADPMVQTVFLVDQTHDLWEDSTEIEDKTLLEFTEKAINLSVKGEVSDLLQGLIQGLQGKKGELPWNLYLKKILGTVESEKKKTTVRRNRRQPHRSDLRGELRDHKAKIMVAIDTSGSISDDEFRQAMIEVMNIVKNYNHEITVVECDEEIQNAYRVKREKDLQERKDGRGGTSFSPVISYANRENINLLIYFTDGEGEEKLRISPRGYKILWILSSKGEKLSLEKPFGVIKKLEKKELPKDLLDEQDVEKGGHSMNHQERIRD